jgi:hypothetical protein
MHKLAPTYLVICMMLLLTRCDTSNFVDVETKNVDAQEVLVATDDMIDEIISLAPEHLTGNVDVQYVETNVAIQRFNTHEDFNAYVELRRLRHISENKPVQIDQSLERYVGKHYDLGMTELSFFNRDGVMIIGDQRYSLEGGKLFETNILTQEKAEILLGTPSTPSKVLGEDKDWIDFYGVTYNSTSYNGFFYIQNRTFTEWGAEKAEAKTKIRLCTTPTADPTGGGCSWFEPNPAGFSSSEVTAVLNFTYKYGGCPSISPYDDALIAVEVRYLRCAGTGATSNHYGQINSTEYLGGMELD